MWRHTLIAYIPDLADLTGMVADMLPPDATTSKKSIVDAMRRIYGGAAQAHRHISEQAETRCGLAGVAALCIAKDVSFP